MSRKDGWLFPSQQPVGQRSSVYYITSSLRFVFIFLSFFLH